MAPRKAPCVVNDISQAQPKVDSHNDLRQHVLAIEEAFRTDAFPMRILTTLMGIEFVDTYRLNQYTNGDTRYFKPAALELFYCLLSNCWDEYNGNVLLSSTRLGNPVPYGSAGCSGAKSPTRMSPRTLAKKHALIPLSSIVGWKGTCSQLLCAICGAKTTQVCVECSTAESVVPLCKASHQYNNRTIIKKCVKIHCDDPDETRHAYPKASGKKRARSPAVVHAWVTP
jgi:hypothetical protein